MILTVSVDFPDRMLDAAEKLGNSMQTEGSMRTDRRILLRKENGCAIR